MKTPAQWKQGTGLLVLGSPQGACHPQAELDVISSVVPSVSFQILDLHWFSCFKFQLVLSVMIVC